MRAIRRFCRQIAAGALIQTNTISFAAFRIFLIFQGSTLRKRIVLYNRQPDIPMLLYLKGLRAPRCFCSKRYQIPFCKGQKGISYRRQNPKKSGKIKVFCMRCSTTLWQFAERAQKTFGAVAKVICYPLDYFACGIHGLHATQIMFCHTAEGT